MLSCYDAIGWQQPVSIISESVFWRPKLMYGKVDQLNKN